MTDKIDIDTKQIAELKVLMDDGFKDFITVYFNEFEHKERELLTAIENKKMDNISKIAHVLKGSSLSVGALGLANVCEHIETASRSNDFKEIQNEYQTLHNIYPVFKKEYIRLSS